MLSGSRHQMYIYVFKTKSLIIPKGRSEFRKSEKDIQHNGLKKKDKGTNSDLQNNAHKAKDRVKRTTLSTRVNTGAPEWQAVPVPRVQPILLL